MLGDEFASRIATSAARAMAGASQQLQAERGERVLDVRLEPYFGLDGAIAGFHLLADDVTWKRQGERDLRAMVNASPEPTLVLDEDSRIQLHNAAAETMFGATSTELVGTPLANWLGEQGGPRRPARRTCRAVAAMAPSSRSSCAWVRCRANTAAARW